MQGLIEFPNNPAFYPSLCDVAKGQFLPDVDPREAHGVSISCNNPMRQNIITCKDEFRHEFINEVNGLSLNTTLTTSICDLPSYIPILDLGSSNIEQVPASFPIVGVTLHHIVSQGIVYKAGQYQEQDQIAFRSKILTSKSFEDKKVILFLTGPDTLIEWIWLNREDCKLYETLRKMGFWAVSGFNFSVIGGECAFGQALNQKRSLFSSFQMEQSGLLSIPHVYAITPFHINRWVHWFIRNPAVKLFTINCQLQKSREDIAQIVRTVKCILERVPNLRVILQGFHVDKIDGFGLLLDRIHFADKVPVKYAQNYRRIVVDVERGMIDNVAVKNFNLKELAVENIIKRSLFIEDIRNKCLQKGYKQA
jgi:hypothetical protein